MCVRVCDLFLSGCVFVCVTCFSLTGGREVVRTVAARPLIVVKCGGVVLRVVARGVVRVVCLCAICFIYTSFLFVFVCVWPDS